MPPNVPIEWTVGSAEKFGGVSERGKPVGPCPITIDTLDLEIHLLPAPFLARRSLRGLKRDGPSSAG